MTKPTRLKGQKRGLGVAASSDVEDAADLAREAFLNTCQQTRAEEDNFGGYLRSIRLLRGQRVAEMAQLVGVTEGKWDSWESGYLVPSTREIDCLVERLQFSPYKRERMLYLLEHASRKVLSDLCRSRLTSLAAHGKAVFDPRLEWHSLTPDLRSKLKAWAHDKEGFELPRDLFDHIASLKTEERIQEWIEEVTGYDEPV